MQQAERKVAVGLVRCSTDMQEHSTEDQESEIRAWAEEHDCDLLQVFRDEGISGSESIGLGSARSWPTSSRAPRRGLWSRGTAAGWPARATRAMGSPSS